MAMAYKNILFLLFCLLSIDCNIFALLYSNNRYSSDHLTRESLRRLQPRGYKMRQADTNGVTTNSTKHAPKLPVPRTQFITKEFRQKVYGKLFTRKDNGATYAGYTKDADTCNLYNKNLKNLWTVLSPYINSQQEIPDDMSLHNIALIITAYLEHSMPQDEDTNVARKNPSDEPKANVPEDDILHKIPELKLLTNLDEITPDEILAIIENNVSPNTKDAICENQSKDKLKRNLFDEISKYLDHSHCFNISNDEINSQMGEQRKVFDKMSFDEAKEFIKEWSENRKASCKLIAKERFLEAIRSIVKMYIEDLKCVTPT